MALASFFNLFRSARQHYEAARAAEAAGENLAALRLYQRAARRGSGPAHYRLGEIHRDGLLGQPPDWQRAAAAFLEAALARQLAGFAAREELIDAGMCYRQLDSKLFPPADDDRESQATVAAARQLLAHWQVNGWLDAVAAPKAGSNLAAQRAQLAARANRDGAAAWTLARRLLSGRWGPAEDSFINRQLSWAFLGKSAPPAALALASQLTADGAGWQEKLRQRAAAGDGEAALWLKRLERIKA